MKKNTVKSYSTSHGFTLIELLAVISIISILAGLAMGAINVALQKGRQIRDVANLKSIVLALRIDAEDNGGQFRVQKDRTKTDITGTTLEVFQGLVDDNLVDDPAVFAGEGATKGKTKVLTAANVGFQYVAGLDTTSASRLPLVFTKGVQVTPSTLTTDTFNAAQSAWTSKGMAVGYAGGSATFLSGKSEGQQLSLHQPLGLGDVPDKAKIYE